MLVNVVLLVEEMALEVHQLYEESFFVHARFYAENHVSRGSSDVHVVYIGAETGFKVFAISVTSAFSGNM